MTEEKRRYPRITVEGLRGRLFFTEKARVLNISLGGIAIEISKRLEIGCKYYVRIEGAGDKFEFKGRVVWASLVGSKKGHGGDVLPVYQAGLKIEDIFNERVNRLIEFINKHRAGESSFEDRIEGLRFKVKSFDGTIIDYPEHYKVKIISQGGMLIELSKPLQINNILPMELQIPNGPPIALKGRIASCIKNEKQKEMYDIGIEFIEMTEENRKKLSELLKSLGL